MEHVVYDVFIVVTAHIVVMTGERVYNRFIAKVK